MADWGEDLERWLAPFLARLGHKARRRMCPLYIAGLIGPGDRKSVEPMASRWAPGDYDRLHHFISSGVSRRRPWASTPKFSGEQRPELQNPSSHRSVGDIQTALREQIFDVAIAERETHIQPNGVPDDRRRELMAGKRDRHAPSYPTTGCALTFA